MDRINEFAGNHPLLIAMLLATITLILWTEFRRLTRKYRDLTPAELVMLINRDKAVVVDIREDAEVRQGKIAGAKHIPLSVFKQRMGELEKFRDRTIVLNCQNGVRTLKACEQLVSAGFDSVAHLRGGITAWSGAGLPLQKR